MAQAQRELEFAEDKLAVETEAGKRRDAISTATLIENITSRIQNIQLGQQGLVQEARLLQSQFLQIEVLEVLLLHGLQGHESYGLGQRETILPVLIDLVRPLGIGVLGLRDQPLLVTLDQDALPA